MKHFSWRYFANSGDPQGYLLYRELDRMNPAEPTVYDADGQSDEEATDHDFQNERNSDTGD